MNSLKPARTGVLATFAILATAILLTGCGAGILGPYDRGPYDRGPYDNRGPAPSSDDRYDRDVDDIQGTIVRVDPLDRRIVVDTDGYRANLRNDGDSGDEIALYYDTRTTVGHQGRAYRPEDLERGDRIRADVDQTGGRWLVEDIEVIYDATVGGVGGSGGSDQYADELRGTVRSIDLRGRTLEIEPSGRTNFSTGGSYDRVVVHWDDRTSVEYQGRRYEPENLERGDRVEIEVRNLGNGLLAEEIEVVGQGRAGR